MIKTTLHFIDHALIFTFFILPILITLLIMYLHTHNKKEELKKELVFRYITLLTNVIVLQSSFLAVSEYRYFSFIMLIGIIVGIIILLIERTTYQTKILARIILAYIAILSMLLVIDEFTIANFAYASACALILFVPIFIINLILLLKANKGTIKRKPYYFMIGFTTKKAYNTFLIINVVLFVIVTTVLSLFLLGKIKINLIFIIIIFLLFLLEIFIYLVYQQIVVNMKPFIDYSKTLDTTQFETCINKMLEEPLIHPEYRNYLLMLYASKEISIDEEKFYQTMNIINPPTNKAYQATYDGLKVNILLEKEEYLHNYQLVKEKYLSNKAVIKQLNDFNQKMLCYYDGKCEQDINIICPVNTPNEEINGINLFIQIYYYYNNQYFDKVRELKALFFQKYAMLRVLKKKLENIQLEDEK